MGNLRTYLVSKAITSVRYELSDTVETYKYEDEELLEYFNKASEVLYEILIDKKSEIGLTGSGTITTVAGTQSYDLDDSSMGDLWVPYHVWVDTKKPMKMCEIDDLRDAINLEEDSQTAHRTEPTEYCIWDDDLWFKEVPDDAYTVYLRYYPNYTLLTTSSSMPFRHIFNQAIIEGVKILAKSRNELDIQVEAILKELFEDAAQKVLRHRTHKPVSFKPKLRRKRR